MDVFELLLLVGLVAIAAAFLSGAGAAIASVAPVPDGSVPSASWFGNVTGTAAAPAPASADVDTLARTIYGEARGAGQSAQEAVASVVMNRVRAGTFPGGRSVA